MALNPEEQAEVLEGTADLLSQELLKVADTKGLVLDQEIAQTIEVTPGKVWNHLDAVYGKLVNAGEQIVARGPRGGKVLQSWGGARVVDNPIRNETLYVMPQPEMTNAVINKPYNDRTIIEARYAASTPSNVKPGFNIEEALTGLRNLKGDDLFEASSVVRANIGREKTKERAAIREQARIQSGLAEAEAALQLNMQLDIQSGVVPRGEVSQQTAAAQAMLDAASLRVARYEASLVEQSSRLADLHNAELYIDHSLNWKAKQDTMTENKQMLAEEQFQRQYQIMLDKDARTAGRMLQSHQWKQEDMRLQHSMNLEKQLIGHVNTLERQGITMENANARQLAYFQQLATVKQNKTAALNATVSDAMLQNYRLVYDSTGNDEQDKLTIVSRRDKDKELAMVIMADRTTTFEMLASPDSSVRQKALALIDGQDKLLNSRDATLNAQNASKLPETAVAKKIREIVDKAFKNPAALVKENATRGIYTSDSAKVFSLDLLTGNDKAKAMRREQLIQDTVNFELTHLLQDRFKTDVRSWISSETTMGPLRDVIDKVKTKDGKVPLDTFIDTLIATDLKDTSGQPIDEKDKMALLNRAIDVAVAQGTRTMMFPPAVNTALADEIKATVNGRSMFMKVVKMLFVDPGDRATVLFNQAGEAAVEGINNLRRSMFR